MEPEQDIDIILASARHKLAFLELVSDNTCPKQDYFLHIFYLIIGDSVRSGDGTVAQPMVTGFVERAKEFDHPLIRLWQQRARVLMDQPSEFDYELWCPS